MKKEHIIIFVLLIFIFASGMFYALTNSITSDELTHITAGYINVHLNNYDFNIEHPPLVKQLAALPLLFMKLNFPFSVYNISTKPDDIVNMQDAFLFRSGNNLDLILLFSRMPNILISVLLGIFIYFYSKKLNGTWAGVLSLALFAFSPSFLGHSPLVTMDTTVSCFYLGTIYFLMRFIETNRNLFLTLTGVFLGLALISKFSALVLIPVLYLLIIAYVFAAESSLRVPSNTERRNLYDLKNYIFLLLLLPLACSYKTSFKFIAPALFAFLFFIIFFRKNTISKKTKYACAVLLIILTIAFAFVIIDYTNFKWFPFHGATKAYFKGFSSFEGHASGGQGDAYLLGMHSDKGWWYYFPLAILVKDPVVFLIVLLAGIVSLFMKKEDAIYKVLLLLPVLAYLFVSMFINKVNIGIRHILPIYPFLYIIAGYSVILVKKFRAIKYAAICLAMFLVVDVSTAYPAHLSYFNSFAEGKGYRFLSDSNLAWGQDWKRLKKYIVDQNIQKVTISAGYYYDKNCEYYEIPYMALTDKERALPEKGYYVIEATELSSGKISWISKIAPVYRIGGSLLIYDINDADIKHLEGS